MSKVVYYIKRVFKLNFKAMFQTVVKISNRSNKNRGVIFFDMIISSLRYGAGYTDYFLFYFENLNSGQRKTYITRTVNNSYLKEMNDSSYYNLFSDKGKFNDCFKEEINRDFIILKPDGLDDFKEFVKKHPTFIAKVISATGGIGVEKIETNEETNVEDLFNELMANKQQLLEEYVIQHEDLNKLCAASVNTLRIVTARKNGKTTVLVKIIRVGDGVEAVDNFHKGGMFTIFDEQGIITKPAVNREGEVFDKHPVTQTEFIGFTIPYYKEAIALCDRASKKIPEVGLVGWDIAITPSGPVMIEGNELPGYDLYQSKVHLDENKHGLKPLFDEVIFGDKS